MGRLGVRFREFGLVGEAVLGTAVFGKVLAGFLMGERIKSEGRSW